MRARRSRSQYALRWERGRPARNPDHARKKTYPFKLCGRGAGLIRVQPSDTKSLEQARLFVPHPPCPPLPQAGEGGSAAPLSHSVGEGLGVRATKSAYPSSTVNPSDVLPIARTEVIIALSVGSPCLARGTAQGFGSPCLQGEPAGGGQLPFFVDFGSAIGVRNAADPYRAQV
jgi:hypothetical protein